MAFEGFWGLGVVVSVLIVLLVIAGVLFFIGLMALLVLSLCRRCRERRQIRRLHPGMADNLIPPIFFTEHLRDPLQQEDLRDKIEVPRL
jgi:hypothetical protein